MCCEADTVALLHRLGRRLTPQRLSIVSALRHAGGHITAGGVLQQVLVQYPCVDASTVYRTLVLLTELRLATETQVGGEVVYEWVTGERHHHLVCRRCGRMEQIDGTVFDQLARQLRRSRGFVAELDHLAVSGICAACAAAGDASPTPPNHQHAATAVDEKGPR